jgi:hypothetical protein
MQGRGNQYRTQPRRDRGAAGGALAKRRDWEGTFDHALCLAYRASEGGKTLGSTSSPWGGLVTSRFWAAWE